MFHNLDWDSKMSHLIEGYGGACRGCVRCFQGDQHNLNIPILVMSVKCFVCWRGISGARYSVKGAYLVDIMELREDHGSLSIHLEPLSYSSVSGNGPHQKRNGCQSTVH